MECDKFSFSIDDSNHLSAIRIDLDDTTSTAEIDQYHESFEITWIQMLKVHKLYDVPDMKRRFKCVLGHYSKPRTHLRKFVTNEEKWSAILGQWQFYGREHASSREDRVGDRRPYSCICSHDITDLHYVRNINTRNTLMIGNCCITKFAKGSKLAVENEEFNSSDRRVRRNCKNCTSKCYALDLQGGYCSVCYEKATPEEQSELDRKKYCAHCFRLRKIPKPRKRCNKCRKANKKILQLHDEESENTEEEKSIEDSEDNEKERGNFRLRLRRLLPLVFQYS